MRFSYKNVHNGALLQGSILFFCLNLFTSLKVNAAYDTPQPEPKPILLAFTIDRYLSPYAAANQLHTGRWLLDHAIMDRISPLAHHYMLGRYGLMLTNGIVNYMGMMTHHEVCGHGFCTRANNGVPAYKNFRWSITSPLINTLTTTLAFIPTACFTPYDRVPCQNYKWDHDLIYTTSGSQASQTLASELVLQNLGQKTWTPYLYHLFLVSFSDLPGYLLFSAESGDTQGFRNTLCKKYPMANIKMKNMRTAAGLFFLGNPMLYMSFAAIFSYVFYGKKRFPLPLLRLGSWSYLPTTQLVLTPFGAMGELNNYFHHTKWGTIRLSVFLGQSLLKRQYHGGIALKTHNLWSPISHMQLDFWVRLWRQPKLILGPPDKQLREDIDKTISTMHWGALGGIIARFWLHHSIGLQLGALYKSEGFVPSVVVDKGFVLQAGICLRM